MSEIVEALKAGRALVAAGWTQGILHRPAPDGSIQYCALGAIWAATKNPVSKGTSPGSLYMQTYDALLKGIEGTGFISLGFYNDKKERTQQDILDLFDRAIVLQETQDSLQETQDAMVDQAEA